MLTAGPKLDTIIEGYVLIYSFCPTDFFCKTNTECIKKVTPTEIKLLLEFEFKCLKLP